MTLLARAMFILDSGERGPKSSQSESAKDSVGETEHLIKAVETRGIKKEPIKSSNLCIVTFRFPADGARNAKKVTIVGDFNEWNQKATPLKKSESGDFETTLVLAVGREYKFRYLIDGERWENDWHADKYIKSPYGVEDSVVCV